ncbi:CPBP family intramembrane glutamic endopeptidase [Natrinema altunense]|uniref:CPBP family intramembrane metalloprotease n=1 Tax=Natrinema altunense TaxID=222984 RepID=A0A482XV40_9EURY|nr:CPBP family intramembrane glutamic endopeptidase [Natrinema altunense]RZH66702.1 CPBP family intramembrane metalloprotease [Natrinema altunense]
MPQWATFVGITGVVLALLLVLSHLTQSAFTDGDPDPSDGDPRVNTTTAAETGDGPGNSQPRDAEPAAGSNGGERPAVARDSESTRDDRSADAQSDAAGDPHDVSLETPGRRRPADSGVDPDSLSTGLVLANVAFSQGLFALVLLGAAIYTAVPAAALGIELSVAYLRTGLLWGTAAGCVFYVANELAGAAATRVGFDHDEALRELLSPDSLAGWLVLLLGVLPIIAFFEEFLFRAALIGVPAAGYGLSPWLLAVGSSIAFALGHGMQGPVGVVVTGLLGFVLAAVFIVTGSLLVVVVAHYLINALEFVVHEGIGLEWAEPLEG